LDPWPTVQRLAEYYYYFPRRPELIRFTRGRHGRAPWYHDWRKVAARVLLPGATAIAAYYHSLETVPYTNRTHLVVLPPRLERWLGNLVFDSFKEEHAAKILPSDHRDSIRVRKITSEILCAAERTLAPVKRGGEILDDRWLAKSYADRQSKAMTTRHLDGLDWEVIVVQDKEVNAMCVPGKIVVYTGLLHYCKTDGEMAFVLGHEVARF
jgi:Zn-dependent protease with chaperone function